MASRATARAAQQRSSTAHHAGQGGALQLDALACIDVALAVQRQVTGVLAHQDMPRQVRYGQATRDRPAGRGRLNDGLALRARVFRPHMTNHHEARRHVLQHLGHVLSEQAQRAVAVLAGTPPGVGGLVHHPLARQVVGQRLACAALTLVGAGRCRSVRTRLQGSRMHRARPVHRRGRPH